MSQIVVAQRMWQRRDTAANWTSKNPVLAAGEIGVELGAAPADTKFKIGTGAHPWNSLPYYAGGGGPTGSLVPGPGVTLTGNPEGRLVGAGDVQISVAEAPGGAGGEILVADGVSPPVMLTDDSETDFLYQG